MKDRLKDLITHLVPTGSVLQRTVKSGVWVTATKMSLRMSQMVMLVILARLLSPRAFGLMGVALLTLAATERFTDIGLNAALIQQKEENIDGYLNTTWSLEIARGLLIFSFVFVAAPFIADFFDEPGATTLVRALGFVPVLYGLRNPAVVYFEKDLSYHKDFVLHASGAVSQLAVGVGYALYSPTVWALVFATMSQPAVRLVLSYVLHDYRPRPAFDLDMAKELIQYGKWITGASIVGYLYSQGDDAFVGWYLSATALGFYQYAYRLADLPAKELSGIISKITFPAYSQLQADTDKLRDAFLQSTRLTAFVSFPLSFGIALVAPSFVPAVLGEDWTPMIRTMQLLTMYGLLHAITRNFGSIWKALNHPDYVAKLGFLRVICIGILIWPMTARFGIEGTALTVVGVYIFPMLPLDVYLAAKVVEGRSIQIYREYLYPFIAASTMFGSLWYARGFFDVSPLVEFVVLVPAGAIVYFTVALFLERQFDWGIENIIRTLSNGIRG